jgi:hypothetical protein
MGKRQNIQRRLRLVHRLHHRQNDGLMPQRFQPCRRCRRRRLGPGDKDA